MDNGSNKRSQKIESELIEETNTRADEGTRENDSVDQLEDTDVLDEALDEPTELGPNDSNTLEAERAKEEDSRSNLQEIKQGDACSLAAKPVEQQEVTEEEKKTREARGKKRTPKPRLRLIPIWLRILIAIVLIGGSLILGLMFGFGVIGGHDPAEVIRPETWYHIIDFIRGET
ncbi:DNA-directed RNA polymerase subunit beta [Halalkalibacter lacteus]|uniref:DNA-directed RNA polymerase subunit beta n=1 Tax=Halalkalibacter lacteus TaxID=3090663 RepID=UPI002FC66E4D